MSIAYRTELPFSTWLLMRDGDYYARSLFDRHYSRHFYKDGRHPKKFVGPGEYLVLMTPCGRGLFVWRKFISKDGQKGVNCAIFRNESTLLSSQLILAAEEVTKEKWPGARFYTYVNPSKIKSKNPGYCFKSAGWRYCGLTKSKKLHILEKLP